MRLTRVLTRWRIMCLAGPFIYSEIGPTSHVPFELMLAPPVEASKQDIAFEEVRW